MGGPILQNSLFFFANYQGGRQETPPTDTFATVVPDAWRQGDLSSLLARNIIIRDPLTRQPFPNNQIPVERFSQFARNLFADEALYPRANVARPLSDFRENYRGTTASTQDVNQFDLKSDWNASAKRQVVRALLAPDERRDAAGDGHAAVVLVGVRQPVLGHGRELEPHLRIGGRQRPAGRLLEPLGHQRFRSISLGLGKFNNQSGDRRRSGRCAA